ncbi:MAG: hypothetical protein MK008_02410 [Bdellovibrionales bacterium]|nr:hypothetical protein [Bdellovibrionales bacterium]
MQGFRRGFVRTIINRVKHQAKATGKDVPTILFPEGRSSKILKALNTIVYEGVANPILLGYEDQIKEKIDELELESLKNIPIIHPSCHENFSKYVDEFYELKKRKGILHAEAERLIADPFYFGSMMLHKGHADGIVCGATRNYVESVRPILQVVGTGARKTASGLNIVLIKDKMLFFADTTVNIEPTAEQLATIAVHASRVARYFKIEPHIAMLSYSNFSGKNTNPEKMREATRLVKERYPTLNVDGEMQADTAVNPEIVERIFPFCELKNGANILIFPNLDSGNISYKLLQQLGGGEVMGPFLMGVKKPANVLQRTCTVDDIINTVVMTALEAQAYENESKS